MQYCRCSYVLFFLSKRTNKKRQNQHFKGTPLSAETSVFSLIPYIIVFTLTFFPEKAMPNLKISVIPSSRISASYFNVVICCNASSARRSRFSSSRFFSHFYSKRIPGYRFSLGIMHISYLPSPDSLFDLILY